MRISLNLYISFLNLCQSHFAMTLTNFLIFLKKLTNLFFQNIHSLHQSSFFFFMSQASSSEMFDLTFQFNVLVLQFSYFAFISLLHQRHPFFIDSIALWSWWLFFFVRVWTHFFDVKVDNIELAFTLGLFWEVWFITCWCFMNTFHVSEVFAEFHSSHHWTSLS